MNVNTLLPVSCLALVIAAGTGCNGTRPDLVPERRSGSQGAEGFCRRSDSDLTVRVRNQANPDALQQSSTVVVFSPGGPKTASTMAIPGGSFDDVTVQIPSGCFNPDCDFTITVDANNDVAEAAEGNNEAEGICIG